MKTLKPVFFLCVALCFASSCKKEADMTLMQKTVFQNADIRQIEVSDAWQVTVVSDSITFVELSYSAYLEPYLKAKMEGTQLEIGFAGNVRPLFNSTFRATIHTNKIDRVEAEDASKLSFSGSFTASNDTLSVNLDKSSVCTGLSYSGSECMVVLKDASLFLGFHLTSTNVEVRASKASTCKGNFNVRHQLVANLDGASQLISFGGTASKGTVKLQGSSLLNIVQTEVGELQVDLSGASEATVNVSNSLKGRLSDASTLYYKGHPQLDIDSSEDSRVIPF